MQSLSQDFQPCLLHAQRPGKGEALGTFDLRSRRRTCLQCGIDCLDCAGRQSARPRQQRSLAGPRHVHRSYRVRHIYLFETSRDSLQMFFLQQQTNPDERKVPSLRMYLKKPRAWIAALLFIALLGMMDSFRAPADQLTARLYIGGIHLYQKAGRPMLSGVVECRYEPSCSEYSQEAVRRHGIRAGLRLTFKRLSACRPDAPSGTYDPVPDSP